MYTDITFNNREKKITTVNDVYVSHSFSHFFFIKSVMYTGALSKQYMGAFNLPWLV